VCFMFLSLFPLKEGLGALSTDHEMISASPMRALSVLCALV
jgi:hypothetical protein